MTRDRTIRPETVTDRAERLRKAVDRVLAEFNQDRKRALFHVAVNASIRVAHDRGDLGDWLEKAWSWLEAHPDHPEFDQREDLWLAELETYCRLSDALEDAKRMLV